VANRPTAQFGKGGSDGATRPPTAYLVPARRARLLPAANDNKPPLKRRLIRLAAWAAIAGAVAFLVFG